MSANLLGLVEGENFQRFAQACRLQALHLSVLCGEGWTDIPEDHPASQLFQGQRADRKDREFPGGL